jgi:hypothetical protein
VDREIFLSQQVVSFARFVVENWLLAVADADGGRSLTLGSRDDLVVVLGNSYSVG